MTRLTTPACGLALLLFAVPGWAQTPAPAHVSQVEGQATVERDAGTESAVADLPVLAGDRVRTDQGRVEILLGDGSVVHMDEQTVVDVNAETVVRLLDGRLVVAGEPGAAGVLQVDTAPASVRLVTAAEVRLSLTSTREAAMLDVGVVRGEVEVITDAGTSTVRAGERVLVDEGEAPSLPVAFNSARLDAFYRWSDELLDSRRGTESAAYLPSDLAPYSATFDEYRQLGLPGAVRQRLVSHRGRRLATVPIGAPGGASAGSAGPSWAGTPGPGRRTTTGAGA